MNALIKVSALAAVLSASAAFAQDYPSTEPSAQGSAQAVDYSKLDANADGSISKMYCSYCYEKGEFTYKGNDVKEFQELNKQKMMEGGHSRFFAWLFTRGMKRLGRWKNK